jgi:hypothetical protein
MRAHWAVAFTLFGLAFFVVAAVLYAVEYQNIKCEYFVKG